MTTQLDAPHIGARIPKLIPQTYGTRDLPEALQRNVADLKASNPGWDYRFYDDAAIEAFLREHYSPAIGALYQRIDPRYGAARADLFRYLVIYKLGGVYLDIKSRFLRPIDDVLTGDEAFILSQWSNGPGQKYEGFGLTPDVAQIPGGEFQQWHVIARLQHRSGRHAQVAFQDALHDQRGSGGHTAVPPAPDERCLSGGPRPQAQTARRLTVTAL